MSLFKRATDNEILEKRRRKVADALGAVNENYVWNISKSSHLNGEHILSLEKIVDGKNVHLQGYQLYNLTPRSIRGIARYLLNQFPEARVNFSPKNDVRVLGFYASMNNNNTKMIEPSDNAIKMLGVQQ